MRDSRRIRVILALLAAILLSWDRSWAGDVNIDVNLGVPPPPRIQFDRPPPVVLVPDTDVYYLPDTTAYDFYRHGDDWYMNRDGYWYHAQSYRGPFSPVEILRVPGVIVGLPSKYRRHPPHPHGGPPGQMKKGDDPGHGGAPPGQAKGRGKKK